MDSWCISLPLVALSLVGFGEPKLTPIRASGNRVIVYQVPVLAFRTTEGARTPEVKAANVAARLASTSGNVTIGRSKSKTWLERSKTILTEVDTAEASANGVAPESLAKAWATNLNAALDLPALKLAEASSKIAEGTQQPIKLVGKRAHEVAIQTTDPQVATVERTPEGFVLKGGRQGRATITFWASDVSQQLAVEVWPLAAQFPQPAEAAVIGLPANPEAVKGAIEGAIRTQMRAVQDAKLEFEVGDVGAVETGASRVIPVRVKVSAPRAFTSEGLVNVAVKNLALPRKTEAELWYCNEPESLKKPGALFMADLKADQPVRMLYHHVNDSSFGLVVRIQVINDSDKTAEVSLIPGDSRPDRNPVLAGFIAADQYLKAWVNGSGEVVSIPPKSSMPLSLRRIGPGETMSGLAALRLIAGGPEKLSVRADAIPPFEADDQWAAAIASNAPWRFVGAQPITRFDQTPSELSSHVYPVPYKQEEVDYQVGGRYGFVRIGQKPIARSDQSGALSGNFGVIYTIKANAVNPTQEPSEVEIVFEASAGYAGALFVVNGQIKRAHPLPPKGETQLARFTLESGASKQLTLVTVPHSGGSYPATVTIRPVRDAN